MTAIALSIAGSDPSGGAGIQADLKVFHQFKTIGWSVPSLLTIQNSRGVQDVIQLRGKDVAAQLSALLEDATPAAVKTGALGSADVVHSIAELLRPLETKLIIDPVIMSSSGTPLLQEDGLKALVENLLPQCYLITPNIAEASALSGIEIHSEDCVHRALAALRDMGAKNVLITGGHSVGKTESVARDTLLGSDGISVFESPLQNSRSTHGTGCTFSAAITALLAQNTPLVTAVRDAKHYIDGAIAEGVEPMSPGGTGNLNFNVPASGKR